MFLVDYPQSKVGPEAERPLIQDSETLTSSVSMVTGAKASPCRLGRRKHAL